MITLADIQVRGPSQRSAAWLRLTSGAHFVDGDIQYSPDLIGEFSFTQRLFSDTPFDSVSQTSTGEVTINNLDGYYDYLRLWSFDACEIRLTRVGNEDSVRPELPHVVGRMVVPSISLREIEIKLKNRQKDLEIALSLGTFTYDVDEDTDLSMYVGGEEQIKDQIKPQVWGRCMNVPLYLLNTYQLLYACNYDREGELKSLANIYGVYSRGGRYEFQEDFPDLAGLLAADVNPAEYCSCLALGLVRLGTVPGGEVTADAAERDDPECYPALVIDRMLQSIGWDGEDYDRITLLSLADVTPIPSGVYVTDSVTVLDAVTNLLSSARLWGHPDRGGRYRFGAYTLFPDEIDASLPFITEDDFEEDSLEFQEPGTPSDVPCYRYDMKHSRNWLVMAESSTLVSLDLDRRRWLAEADRTLASEELSALKDYYPSSEVLEHDTLLQIACVVRMEDADFMVYEPDEAWWTLAVTGAGVAEFIPAGGVLLDATAKGEAAASATQTVTFPSGVTGNFRAVIDCMIEAGNLLVTLAGQTFVFNVASYPDSRVTRLTLPFVLDDEDEVTFEFAVDNVPYGEDEQLARVFNCRIENADHADALREEVNYRGRMVSGIVERYTLTTDLDFGLSFSCGSPVVFFSSRNDLQNGRQFMVIQMNEEWEEEETEMELYRITERVWGSTT